MILFRESQPIPWWLKAIAYVCVIVSRYGFWIGLALGVGAAAWFALR